jgi:hypothetical protein
VNECTKADSREWVDREDAYSGQVLRVTVDTNVRDHMERIRKAAAGLDVEIAPTTVTYREHGITRAPGDAVKETMVWNESPWDQSVWGPSPPVYETAVIGEWRIGMAVIGSEEGRSRFEAILAAISNGSFPKPGARDSLTKNQRRQLRDAMILEAHTRDGRDVLVSNDEKAFIGPEDERRIRLEALCRTKILKVDEFCEQVATLAAP